MKILGVIYGLVWIIIGLITSPHIVLISFIITLILMYILYKEGYFDL